MVNFRQPPRTFIRSAGAKKVYPRGSRPKPFGIIISHLIPRSLLYQYFHRFGKHQSHNIDVLALIYQFDHEYPEQRSRYRGIKDMFYPNGRRVRKFTPTHTKAQAKCYNIGLAA